MAYGHALYCTCTRASEQLVDTGAGTCTQDIKFWYMKSQVKTVVQEGAGGNRGQGDGVPKLDLDGAATLTCKETHVLPYQILSVRFVIYMHACMYMCIRACQSCEAPDFLCMPPYFA
jgi:hypothetical protein